MDAAQKPEQLNPEEPPKGEDLNLHAETNGSHVIQPEEFWLPNKEQVTTLQPEGTDNAIEIAVARRKLEVVEHTPREAVLGLLMDIVEPAGDQDPLTQKQYLSKLWESVDLEKRNAVEELAELVEHKYELMEEIRISKKIFDRTVEATRNIIDATSGWTADHSTRLTIAGYEMSERMWDFPDTFQEAVWQGGLLHDLGKIGVPKSILEKPGRLDMDTEKPVMDSHAWLGYEILNRNFARNLPYITDSTFHHETWSPENKWGYSYGRKLAEIPVMSQILAVTDVADAILSFRPYKQGVPPDEMVGEIEKMEKNGHFSPLASSLFVSMYEGREISFANYFQPHEAEEKIVAEMRSKDEFSKEKNESVLERDKLTFKKALAGQSSSTNGYQKLADYELGWQIQQLTPEHIDDLKTQLNLEIDNLREKQEEKSQVNMDALFLMITSVEARFLAYQDTKGMQELMDESGKKIDPDKLKENMTERLREVRKRTENRVRYSLMLAQQMGLSLEEQKQVVLGSMFAPMGMLGVDENKVVSEKVLGIKSYEEFKKVPEVGYKLLKEFMDDPEISPFFEGAGLGPADVYKWYNGGGYGVRLNGVDDKPSKVGKICALPLKYVAMISAHAYREALDPDTAMAELRKGVGTEFDPEVFKYWEQLYAQYRLNIFKERPEIVEDAKMIILGHALSETQSSFRNKIAEISDGVTDEVTEDERLKLLLEGMQFAESSGRFDEMERLLARSKDLLIKLGDASLIDRVIALYGYDLQATTSEREQYIEGMVEKALDTQQRTKALESILGAVRSLRGMATDHAEMGQVIPVELADRMKEKILPVYTQIAESLLPQYRASVLEQDGETQNALETMLDRAVKDLGDEELRTLVEGAKHEAAEQKLRLTVERYLLCVIKDIDKGISQDPLNSEHCLAMARLELRQAGEHGYVLEGMEERVESVSKKFFAAGYMPLFRQMKRMGDKGEVRMAEVLEDKVRSWMSNAGELISPITEEVFEGERKKARRNGIKRLVGLLEQGDLGFEDIKLIGRWVSNIEKWQGELEEEVVDPGYIKALEFGANARIREVLDAELEPIIEKGDEISLKRLMILIDAYIVEPGNPQLLDQGVLDIKERAAETLMEMTINRLSRLAEEGADDKFEGEMVIINKFCRDKFFDRSTNTEREVVRIVLTEDQEAKLQSLLTRVRSVSLMKRCETIREQGSQIDISRIMSEITDMREIWKKFDIGTGVDGGENYSSLLSGAVEEAFATRVERAIATEDDVALAESFGDLMLLRKQEGQVEIPFTASVPTQSMESWVDQIKGRLPAMLRQFSVQGDIKHLQMVIDALDAYGLEAVEGDARQELIAMALQIHMEQSKLRIKLDAAQSAIGKVRREQERVRELLSHYPGLSVDMSEISEIADASVDKFIVSHENYDNAVRMIGPVMQQAKEIAQDHVQKMVKDLELSEAGRADLLRLSRMFSLRVAA